MPVKIDLAAQIETMKAVIVAEGWRNAGLVGRGDLTQGEADDAMVGLNAVLGTLEYLQANRKDFLDFRRAREPC